MIGSLRIPVIAAPMAGGVSTPALAAAVTTAGGLGFLAAGYQTPQQTAADIEALRALTAGPFGLNLFVPEPEAVDRVAVGRYRDALSEEAARRGVRIPDPPEIDDDHFAAKVDLAVARAVPVVSFTFGCPDWSVLQRLRAAGATTVVTVTSAEEAMVATRAGADALCVQGPEAGGHRGSFAPLDPMTAGDDLMTLLAKVIAAVQVPVVAAGGLMDGADVARVLSAGAVAGQLGTAFVWTPESGAVPAYRAALADPHRGTTVTTAFTGRPARGLTNKFIKVHSDRAPLAYPQVHHLTKPLRAAAAAANDPEGMAMWAGTGYHRGRALPAADLMACLAAEIRAAQTNAAQTSAAQTSAAQTSAAQTSAAQISAARGGR
jgi:nitronate monooxygenase